MSSSTGKAPATPLEQLEANLRDPTWHSIPPPSLEDTFKTYKRNKDYRSIAEEGLFGKDYGGKRLESCIEQMKRNYSWMGDKVSDVIAEARTYPLPLDPKKLNDLEDQLSNASVPSEPLPKPFETVQPSLNFFQFQGSVPEDYDSDTTIEELAKSIEHVSLSEVSQALQKVHLAVEVQIAEQTLAKEVAYATATNRINLPWDRIVLPSDPSRIYGDWETLRTMPEFIQQAADVSKPTSSSPFIYVFVLCRLSREPDNWFPNDAATTQDVQLRLQGLVIAGFNAAVQYGFPLDRVVVVPALQVAGLAVPVAGWQLFDHRIIPAQFQGITHVPSLHLFHLIVVYGSTGAGQLFLDPDLILLLIGILFPNLPANVALPPPGPPPPPAAPGLPPPPPPPPNQQPPPDDDDDQPSDDDMDENDDDEDDSSDGSDDNGGQTRRKGVDRRGDDGETFGESQVGKGKGKAKVDKDKGRRMSEEDRNEAFKNSNAVKRFKPSVQFCFILAVGGGEVQDFWSSMEEFVSTIAELRTTGTATNPEAETILRDLLAHLVGRESIKVGQSRSMKEAQAFVKKNGHSVWKGRNKDIAKTLLAKRVPKIRITPESIAVRANLPSTLTAPSSSPSLLPPAVTTKSRSSSLSSSPKSQSIVPQKGSSRILAIPPFGSNSRIRAAKPWDLTSTEQHMLQDYPTPDHVLATEKQAQNWGLTLPDLLAGKLDAVERSMVLDRINLQGNLRPLVCDIKHTIAGTTKNCKDSFFEHQRGLSEFHKLYHTKWSDEICTCARCNGKLPSRFLGAHARVCNGRWNEGPGDQWHDEGSYRQNEFVFWFSY